jgi:hypothetical protein
MMNISEGLIFLCDDDGNEHLIGSNVTYQEGNQIFMFPGLDEIAERQIEELITEESEE